MARVARRSRTLRDLAELEDFAALVDHSDAYRPISTQDFLPNAQLYGLGGFGALAYLGDDATDPAADDSSGDWTDALKSVTDVVGGLATTGANIYKTVTGTPAQTPAQKAAAAAAAKPASSSNTMLLLALAAGAVLIGGAVLSKRR